MTDILRLMIFQMDTLRVEIHQNIHKIETLLSEQETPVDILILPEMFNTGYIVEKNVLTTEFQEITFARLQAICKQWNVTILGSIPFYDISSLSWYNSVFIWNKTGYVRLYDKVHLFGLGGENDIYQKGESSAMWSYAGWNIQPLICYDLRFPYIVSTENHPDLLIYSAQWPETRIGHWKALLRARAIEHQCYVAGVNRFGYDHNGVFYSGDSLVYDYKGDVVAECDSSETFRVCDLDINLLIKCRQKFPFLKDWRI